MSAQVILVTPEMPDDARALVSRFQRAQLELANNVSKIAVDIAAHPRHNAHVGDLEIVIELLEQVVGCSRVAVKRVY